MIFQIKEFIFDGVQSSPDVPTQGMDMHSCYFDSHIFYPHANYSFVGTEEGRSNLIKYNPQTNGLTVHPLDYDGPTDSLTPYHVIEGKEENILWVYSAYGTRSLWRFDTTDNTSTYYSSSAPGNFGGKLTSIEIGGTEYILSTSVTGGYLEIFNVSTKTFVKTLADSWAFQLYGIQCDALGNIFVQGADGFLRSFTLDGSLNPSTPVSISSSGLDIAWDGEDIWVCSSAAGTQFIERFKPVYTADVVTSFTRLDPHYTGHPTTGLAVSIKANDNYVVACWESTQTLPTLSWSILDRNTNTWSDFFNQVTQKDTPEGVYPYTGQYWETVTVEADVPNQIYITGYSPALQGGEMDETNCPNLSMRILKFTPIDANNAIKGATITGAVLYP